MSLLAILFSLAIEHYYNAVEQFRNYQWISSFSNWIKERFSDSEYWNDTIGLIATILVPMFVCALIYGVLDNAMGLLGFLFSLLVLLYCIGPQRFLYTARQLVDAGEHDDQHSLQTYADELLGTESSELDSDTYQQVSARLINFTNEGLLSIFFWFILLGPMGALMCRMVNVLYSQTSQSGDEESEESENSESTDQRGFAEFNTSTRMLYAILLWLPAQLTMLTFAITGSFVDTLREWKSRLSKDYLNPQETETTLFRTGFNALQLNPDDHQHDLSTVEDVLALCWRSLIVWVTALALLTLAGLAG